jgi:hypothetical protein
MWTTWIVLPAPTQYAETFVPPPLGGFRQWNQLTFLHALSHAMAGTPSLRKLLSIYAAVVCEITQEDFGFLDLFLWLCDLKNNIPFISGIISWVCIHRLRSGSSSVQICEAHVFNSIGLTC